MTTEFTPYQIEFMAESIYKKQCKGPSPIGDEIQEAVWEELQNLLDNTGVGRQDALEDTTVQDLIDSALYGMAIRELRRRRDEGDAL
jgi:hypothetical protein